MPWESKRQQRWGHGKGGKKAGFTPEKIKEWDEETDFESLPEESPKESKSSFAFSWALGGLPFPGAAPPFGSKDEDEDDESESNETATTGESLARKLSWGTFALDAIPDTMTSDPGEHDEAVDHSEDGEARDMSTAGFASATRLTANQPGITSPVSKLPSPPPGAAEKAKKKERAGRGVEGDEDNVDPMSTIDKFNWDSLPLPGMGQI